MEPERNTNVLKKLQAIQIAMKAPKNFTNSFGGYKYRNAESILEALKPYEREYGVAVIISDEIQAVGSHCYVRATATMYDTETGESVSSTAYAREAETKKGMDDSQITGSTSSYARKYCLNGLLLLDDTQDADSDGFAKVTNAVPANTAPLNAVPTERPSGGYFSQNNNPNPTQGGFSKPAYSSRNTGNINKPRWGNPIQK